MMQQIKFSSAAELCVSDPVCGFFSFSLQEKPQLLGSSRSLPPHPHATVWGVLLSDETVWDAVGK